MPIVPYFRYRYNYVCIYYVAKHAFLDNLLVTIKSFMMGFIAKRCSEECKNLEMRKG